MNPESAERNEQSRGHRSRATATTSASSRSPACSPAASSSTSKPGDTLERGQRVGLIKFGSRCRRPAARRRAYSASKRGQRVKGGSSILADVEVPVVRAQAGSNDVMETRRRLDAEEAAPRRGMYVLPSLFTAGNIAAGYYAITQSLQGSRLEPGTSTAPPSPFGFAIPFDALDGRIARMTNTTSDFGKELDSLADVITFGVAPSILAYIWGFRILPMTIIPRLRRMLVELGAFVCFLFLLCGASRLARFNISHDPQPKNPGRPDRKYFVGMPIPAAAGVIAAVVHCFNGTPMPTGAWHSCGSASLSSPASSWSALGASGAARRSTSPAAIPSRCIVLLGVLIYLLWPFL